MTDKVPSRSIPAVILDTSALFSGIWSERGGSRLLLQMGEAQIIQLQIGKQVIFELEDVLKRKAPNALRTLAILLDRSRIEIVPEATLDTFSLCSRLVNYVGDAQVLAEAWESGCEYFVTLDKLHFIQNRILSNAPFEIGTPGDCLAWLRIAWSR